MVSRFNNLSYPFIGYDGYSQRFAASLLLWNQGRAWQTTANKSITDKSLIELRFRSISSPARAKGKKCVPNVPRKLNAEKGTPLLMKNRDADSPLKNLMVCSS
jgi:hypothetical protein